MALGSWRTSCESRGSRSADPGKSRRKVRPSVRVRVSGMGLVLVGSFLAFRVEALAASAGRPVVRVAHEEAAPRDAFGVVHARAIEVFLAVVVQVHGLKVLVDGNSKEYLDGSSVDYAESVAGSGFLVSNPNNWSTCGCGQSFNPKGEEAADQHESHPAHAHTH